MHGLNLNTEVEYSIEDIIRRYCDYKKSHFSLFVNNSKKFFNFAENLYLDAKYTYKVYFLSFAEFKNLLEEHNHLSSLPYWYRYRVYPLKYYFCPSPEYRKKKKYQKNKAKQKNKPKNKSKEDWRKHKKLRRDKSRRESHWNPRACPKWNKRKANGSHRAWERANIRKGNWDELLDCKKLDFFQDPWDWD